jgi:hypothetical protein
MKLLGSAGAQADIEKLIGRFWFSNSITLQVVGENTWEVLNGGKRIDGFRVVLRKNRYRFEADERDALSSRA